MGTLDSPPLVGGTVASPHARPVGTVASQSGTTLTVYAQGFCVSLVEGRKGSGINMNTDQCRELADLLLKAALVVQGKAVAPDPEPADPTKVDKPATQMKRFTVG
jgi:hypothetical protein